jgi:histidinol phosphatase-like PHP family hydrolase
MSEGEVQKRTFEKIERYRESTALNYKLSSLRLEYLEKTIKFLNSHGQVYLVRLPVDPLMLEIEDKFMPNFNQKLMEVAKSTNGYLDLTTSNNEFQYVDGNHIYKESGKKVTSMIAELIN